MGRSPRTWHHDDVGYGPDTYGESFADVYDDWYGDMDGLSDCVETIYGLSLGGMVLELGVGTGRIAIPLAQAGCQVVGVDASPAMLSQLARRDPGGAVQQHLGTMAGPLPDGPFQVVFVAYNTFFNMTSARDQLACLTEVRRCLASGGHLVIEAFVPDRFTPERGVDARTTADGIVLNVTRNDPVSQVVLGQQVQLGEDGVRLRPWQIRYLTPLQLDELAVSVGLGLVARWSDWAGTLFDHESQRHVSVYAPR